MAAVAEMYDTFPMRRYALTPIAESGDRFADFAPYVASINNAGVVAFQAALRGGGSGVFTGSGGAITSVVETGDGPLAEVCSHPDINADGAICFYAARRPTGHGVFLVRDGRTIPVADTRGPLGPTMNDAGLVAFRVGPDTGEGEIRTGDGRTTTLVAQSGDCFSRFLGLPVVNGRGAVALRADLATGGQGLYVGDGGDGGALTTIVETGERFAQLGSFPILNDAGTVAFSAVLRSGGAGVFAAAGGRLETVIDSSGPFESFRGVLINNAGQVVFYATPRGGALGVFTGPDPATDRVISMGGPLLGSTVADFALNPVSFNDRGQLAIRARLADGRHFILRADPV